MKKNSFTKISRVVCAIAFASGCAFGAFAMTGCAAEESENVPEALESDTGLTGGVAATVNGVEIEEDKVTRAINNMRLNYGYTEDDKWKEYLENGKYTVESLRYEVVGQLVDQQLVEQCAEKAGVTTDDEEIDSYVKKMSDQYSSEEAWLSAVDEAGWESVDKYKETLKYQILEKKLKEKFQADAESEFDNSNQLIEIANEKASEYDGAKHTARILFSSEDADLANEVYEKLKNGEISFADAVSQYSIDEDTKSNGGDMGWNIFNSPPTSEYIDAIENMNAGDISEPVSDQDGINIINATEVWNKPTGDITSKSQLPDEFVTEIRTDTVESEGDDRYDDWLDTQHVENDVTVNPMPENVPYYVDMSGVYTEEEAKEIDDRALSEVINGVTKTEEEMGVEETSDNSALAEAAREAGIEVKTE